MKKEMFMIRCNGERGPMLLAVTGYKSKVHGLSITTDYNNATKNVKAYSITHVRSGIGFFIGEFSSIRKANVIIHKFLSRFDWTVDSGKIKANKDIRSAVTAARGFLYLEHIKR